MCVKSFLSSNQASFIKPLPTTVNSKEGDLFVFWSCNPHKVSLQVLDEIAWKSVVHDLVTPAPKYRYS